MIQKLISLLTLSLAITACSSKNFKPAENKVTVSYKAPVSMTKCENLGSDTVVTKHWAKEEGEALSEDVISDLVQSTCAKRANYIHISKVENSWVKNREISSESYKKEMKKTKVESTYYLCQ